MEFHEVARLLEGIPYISAERGQQLYDFIIEGNVRDVLELAFAHGASTCYMAAALDQQGAGKITTIDTVVARDREPNLDQLLERSGLGRYVHPVCPTVSWIGSTAGRRSATTCTS